jgi:hypothetical protein
VKKHLSTQVDQERAASGRASDSGTPPTCAALANESLPPNHGFHLLRAQQQGVASSIVPAHGYTCLQQLCLNATSVGPNIQPDEADPTEPNRQRRYDSETTWFFRDIRIGVGIDPHQHINHAQSHGQPHARSISALASSRHSSKGSELGFAVST